MNVAQVTAEIHEARGRGMAPDLSAQSPHRVRRCRNIRPIVVRQERIGVHMADAIGRLSSGREDRRVLLPGRPGHRERLWRGRAGVLRGRAAGRHPGWHRALRPVREAQLQRCAELPARHQACETINTPDQLVPALRRAFSFAKNGRPGPVLIEIPGDMWNVEVPGDINYKPTRRALTAPDAKCVDDAAAALIDAKRPLIYAGQGVHYAQGLE